MTSSSPDHTPDDIQLPQGLLNTLVAGDLLDAVYLYGSRAKGLARDDSDWDLAVLFNSYEADVLERAIRPQNLEAELERQFPDLDLSVVDLREVPVPLQWNIIQGIRLFDRGVPAVRRLEHAIISAWEKDYERYC
ncbi:type VII toxin-antitoxin system MntA family adenylyltransferase antitoxin [Bacterioplanoides sp.]|uniref:type VII toxin-antitoxin system MntA family adenylyltransferase antitoxin n=1 Tax=Bacterioplanoides sp. TaxID=2066072 RepID=UPI003B00DC26